MEIRKPKFELGQKVIDKNGNVITVIKFNSYHFEENEYWYDVSYDGEVRIKKESFLKPYIEKSEPEKKTVWDLEERDECYSLTICGNVHHGFWDGSSSSIAIRELGELFLTREEAQDELERRKVETEMLRLGGRRHLKLHKENYCFCFDSQFSSISCECFSCLGICSSIYFDSEKEALKALNTIGKDKIKKYIFGVE